MKILKNKYECKKDWPEDCFVQGDVDGLVLGEKEGVRKTAFFEAFPAAPNSTFIRGEGNSLENAEDDAFKKLSGFLACPEHEFERKDDTGRGKCTQCSIEVSDVLSSTKVCRKCDNGDAGLRSDNQDYCAACYYRKVMMGKYHFTKIADASSEMQSVSEDDWGTIALNMISTRSYYMLRNKGELEGMNSRAIQSHLRGLNAGGLSVHGQLKDIAISYLLKSSSAGEDYARFFTEKKANKMLSSPSLNDSIVDYLYNINSLVDKGVEVKAAHDVNHGQFVSIATGFLKGVLVEGHFIHESGAVPDDAVRARTTKEREQAIGDVIGALFKSLSGDKDVDDEDDRADAK